MRKWMCGLAGLLFSSAAFAGYDAQYKWTVISNGYTYAAGSANAQAGLGASGVNAMAEDKSGGLWMALSGRGLRMWDGKKFQDPKLPKESFARTGEVLCLAVDSKGTLYAGTSDGLVRFDGTEWMNIGREQTGMLAVTGIAITATDKLYVTGQVPGGEKLKEMRGGGLSFYNGQGWTVFTKATTPGMPDDSLEHLVVDGSNHLWALPAGGGAGVAKFDGKNWKLFNMASVPELPSDDVRAIATNASGAVWLATPKGITEYKDGAWKTRAFSNGFNSKKLGLLGSGGGIDVKSLAVENDGSIWMGTRTGEVVSIRPNAVKILSAETSLLPGHPVGKIFVDSKLRKWFVSGERNASWGSYVLRDNNAGGFTMNTGDIVGLTESEKVYDPKWTLMDNTSTDLSLGTTAAMLAAGDGAVWMPNSSDGLVKYKDGEITIYRHPNGTMGSAFYRMAAAPDGKLYLSTTAQGIKVYDNGTISDFAKWPNMGGVMNMWVAKDGTVWSAGTAGLSRRAGDEWETFNKGKGDLPSIIVYTVFQDSKGTIWAGTAKGLAKFDPATNTFQTFGKKEYGFPSDDITALAEGPDGKLYAGSKAGLSIYDGTTWSHISEVASPKLKRFTVNAISVDKTGNVWVGADNEGLLRYDGTSWTQWNRANTGVLHDKVTSVLAAPDGKVYVATEFYEFNAGYDFGMPNATGVQLTEQALNKKVKETDPKTVVAIIQP